jgi:hypothetical protein
MMCGGTLSIKFLTDAGDEKSEGETHSADAHLRWLPTLPLGKER